ncbi:OmpH family outer membrane protein [Flavobacterium wongokense]|uniref:OmpH family outer membrane protein n=1 Tax=Flavobacterium wongokense TaxID=2910674 RepID=UPI001F31E72E|nr:OmpH family outer membrane protein [Flavobacterium sp. WG47]MCF6133248.1 OmpH family outer membrane protein [Flavobacterium sp. WG47]
MPKSLFYSFALILITSTITFFICYKMMPASTVYVDSEKLFTEFKMTKELKKAGEHQLQLKTAKLDSLQLQVRMTQDEKTRALIMQEFIKQQQEIDAFQQEFTALNSKNIWARIATYSADYAEAKGYDFILNSNNNQTVLAGSKKKDITGQLLNYINKKYEGFQ